MSNNKKAAYERLLSENLDPKEIAREHRPELMVPKLALVGVFTSLESFSAAGKNNVIAAIGALNVNHLKIFLGALKNSIELGEKVLYEYQAMKEILVAEEDAQELASRFQDGMPSDDDNESDENKVDFVKDPNSSTKQDPMQSQEESLKAKTQINKKLN